MKWLVIWTLLKLCFISFGCFYMLLVLLSFLVIYKSITKAKKGNDLQTEFHIPKQSDIHCNCTGMHCTMKHFSQACSQE